MNWHPDRYKDRWYQEISGPNGGEIPVPVSANPFVVNISMATEPGQQPLDFKVSDYVKEGNEDGRA
jgi:hypothetical protein